MHEVILHRRATRYLRRMPTKRQKQMRDTLRAVAELDDISTHPAVRPMSGDWSQWFRLRVGTYRVILQPRQNGEIEILYVENIGPRGDIY